MKILSKYAVKKCKDYNLNEKQIKEIDNWYYEELKKRINKLSKELEVELKKLEK